MTVTFTKLTDAAEYEWAGVGIDSGQQAADYGCIVDGKLVATITRTNGGGYMEKATWVAHFNGTLTDMRGNPAENCIIASGSTLKKVKESLAARNWNN